MVCIELSMIRDTLQLEDQRRGMPRIALVVDVSRT
jgi:hypothetical protein